MKNDKAANSAVAEIARRTAVGLIRKVFGRTRVALTDFPAYDNVGDSALWVGARNALRLADANVVYGCTHMSYDPVALRAAIRGGTIALAAGGNFGDVWPRRQQFRERVVRDFPDVRIVQLPQSITFNTQEAIDRCRSIIGAHKNFTLMVRDEKSEAFARDKLGFDPILCPDMAFGMEAIERIGNPIVDVLCLKRRDKESAAPDWSAERALVVDWGGLTPREQWINKSTRYVRRLSGLGSVGRRAALAAFDARASHRVRYGIKQLSSGRVVISDRLHGVLIAHLAGIPVVAVDNVDKKVSALIGTWNSDWPMPPVADSFQEAYERGLAQISSNDPVKKS